MKLATRFVLLLFGSFFGREDGGDVFIQIVC
jgi:hypothetical protein